MDPFAKVSSAAHSGAYGINNLPEPSLANLRAGNYRKGRCEIHGLRIAIETPQGQRRAGKANGEPWSVICYAHYGYIEKTRGADGDELDVFIGPWPESEMVYVVNRGNASGGFDEHKLLMGFTDRESAVTAYRNSYERGAAGILSIVPCTVDQLKWWIQFGNYKIPLTSNQLPFDGTATMNDVTWDTAANPVNMTLPQLLYAMRRDDAGDHLLLDSVTLTDVLEASDGEAVLDALVVPLNRLERKMGQMQVIMRAASKAVRPGILQITPPFKQRGTANVAAIFEMDDGQTVTVYFHNPDATPNKLTPDDEMVSWKWMLNKKDVTIVVAPERGMELNPREVARRIMRLVEANSARFQAANARRAERMAGIETSKASVAAKQAELDALNAEAAALEERVEAKRAAPPATLESNDQVPEGEPIGAENAKAVADVSAAAPYSDQHKLLAALIDIGWQNRANPALQRAGGPDEYYWVTKTIGGGMSTAGNTQGDRVVAARLSTFAQGSRMEATFGDDVLVWAPFDPQKSFAENAKRLDEGVNVIDPRQAQPIPELSGNGDLPEGWTESASGKMATSRDPVAGGIVDMERASGEWFVIPENSAIPQMDGFKTRAEAFAALAVAVDRLRAAQAIRAGVVSALKDAGWEDSDGSAIAKKTFKTVNVQQDALAFLTDGDEYNRTLQFQFTSEGGNVTAADGALIPKWATEQEAAAITAAAAARAEKSINESYGVSRAEALTPPYNPDDMGAAVAYAAETRRLFNAGDAQAAWARYQADPNGGGNPNINPTFEQWSESMKASDGPVAADRLADARAYLATVIDGKVNLADSEVADRLIQMSDLYAGDAEFDTLFAKAADAYQAFMVDAAKKAMG